MKKISGKKTSFGDHLNGAQPDRAMGAGQGKHVAAENVCFMEDESACKTCAEPCEEHAQFPSYLSSRITSENQEVRRIN